MIRYKNYRLEPDNGRFNLTREYTIPERTDPKTKQVFPEHKADEPMGYSMKFESCLHLIAIDLLERNESITTISDYIKAYKAEKEEMLNVLNK